MEIKESKFASQTPTTEEATEASAPEDVIIPPTQAPEDAPAAPAAEAIPTLEEQLAEQRRQTEEYLDHLQRLQAEFNNYRRRASQERLQATSRGKEDMLRTLFPILGNLHLALRHAEQDPNAVRQGVQMIWQQFENFLREQGVEKIATVGQVFDPAHHEALSTVPATADTPPNTIVSEVNAGYKLDGRLLRPAQVVVARAEDNGSMVKSTAAQPEADASV
jgi:molecular chaperone GrpE